ncbi:unnamed protein product [Psylliodes chrysocephalus]|uniref:Uncharacterized protein n=1 Tax=Psylliodes chrysocephalus TaxID=3402493 RepID=A0A9P0CRL6_9CUCU|nr:unnamed protein product [Psylliodes chrysocephala]
MTEHPENLTLETIFDELIRTRIDLKNSIEASETRLQLNFQFCKKQLEELGKENAHLKAKVEQLEIENKKKNIIVFGLNKTPSERGVLYFCNKIKQLMNIDIEERDISNIYSLGNIQQKTEKTAVQKPSIHLINKINQDTKEKNNREEKNNTPDSPKDRLTTRGNTKEIKPKGRTNSTSTTGNK